jgi:E3 ubiquitin-protein ligase RAD18
MPIAREQLFREPPLAPGIQCPMCQRPFKSAEQVDRHIDTCTGVSSAPSIAPLTASSQSYNLRPQRLIQSSSSSQKKVQLVKPLPKLNYAMYNDKQLRAKLSEHALSTYGNKAVLIARHKEYVNVHNANIDRLHPQSRQEILRQMERWDATQQTLVRPEKRKELDGEEWGRRCKSDFEDLARQAKESLKRRKLAEQNANGEGTSVAVAPPKSSQEETIA